MSSIDISGAPLAVNFAFPDRTSNNSPVVRPLQALAPILPGALKPFLTTNLGAVFDGIWASQQAAQTAAVVTQFNAQAAAAGQSARNVVPNFPATGSLTANISDPGSPPTLALNYLLSGCDISFDTGSPDAQWDVSFDATITVSTPVPVRPFSLSPSATIALANANMNADNWVAKLEGAFSDIVNIISFGLVPTVSGSVEGGIDGTQQPTNFSNTGGLITALNNAGPQAIAFGFTECAFSAPQNQLTLTLTHPLDPAPQLVNANNPPGLNLQLPRLMVSTGVATPNQTITAFGANFPLDTIDRAALQWSNTSSGTPVDGQLQFQIADQSLPPQTASGVLGSMSVFNTLVSAYSATVSGLSPDTTFQFQARCGDALTLSQWSDPLTITTASTNTVNLVLQLQGDPNAMPVQVGGADLSATSNAWEAQAVIPAGTPDGDYDLIAQLGGVEIARTSIKVMQVVAPVLEMIDPNTLTVISPAELKPGAGLSFTLRGEEFPDGMVAVTMDGSPQPPVNAVSGTVQFDLTAPYDASGGSYHFDVVATTSGGQSATITITVDEPPK